MKNFFTFIAPYQKKMVEFIEQFLQKKKNQFDNEFYRDVIERLIQFVPTGKLIRSSSCMFTYLSGRHMPDESVYSACAALEIIHSGLLIHDDIMDQDLTRRGKPTLAAQYASFQSQFYGQSMSMIAADICFFLGFELLQQTKLEKSVLQKLMTELQFVGAAQMSDFHYGQTLQEPSLATIEQVYLYKTARYTFSLPFMLGAYLADMKNTQTKIFEQIGEKIGLAFQLRDDYLGIFGDPAITGKPVFSDICENKKTYVRALLMQKLSPVQQKQLSGIFGKAELNNQEKLILKELFNASDAIKQLELIQKQYMNQAQHMIHEKLDLSTEFKGYLNGLVNFVATRQK